MREEEPNGHPMRTERRNGQRARRILIVVGQSGMGDGVEALPVFEMIRQRWSDVYIAAGYFRDAQKPILETSPYISETVRLFGGVRYFRRSIKGLLRNLKAIRGFDTVFFLYKKEPITWPIRLGARLAGARVLYKHGYRYRDERRNTYSDFPEHVFFQIVTSNLLFDAPLVRLKRPEIAFSEQDERFAEEFFSRKVLGHGPTVIINTQSGQNGGNPCALPDWGIERYARVANALVDWGARLIINGGADHQIEEFKSVAHELHNGVALLERPSPRQLAAVFSKCDLYIGAANGPACVAMAVGTPTITLVGPGEHGYPGQERIGPAWWPRGADHKVITKIDWCQQNMGANCRCRAERPKPLKRVMKRLGVWEPWRKARKKVMRSLGIHRRRTVSEIYPCLQAIKVEEVVEEAKRQLNGRI